MGGLEKTKSILLQISRLTNEALSFLVFSFLDLLDFCFCFAFRVADFLAEADSTPCYCSTRHTHPHNCGDSKLVRLTRSHSKVEPDDISDTLFTRPTLFSQVSKLAVKKLKLDRTGFPHTTPFSVKVVEGKIRRRQMSHPIPRWSDCDCNSCTSSSKHLLYVRSQFPKGHNKIRADVLFIHGFISSSAFWTETLFPNFSSLTKSTYRMFAVDLLGFGRSPKPTDSFYTLREHLEMIERSVFKPYEVKSFHVVAHSLGCILALALAAKHPGSVKSVTLLAPPYYPTPKGARATQYTMRRIAPRRVWPPISFGASLACWYEHISRTICLVICKNHRVWEFLAKLVTRDRSTTSLIEGFFSHTHNSAWHTLHNIIFGAAGKMDGYLDSVRESLNCDVNVFHGVDDDLIPVECSRNVQTKIPRATVKVLEKKDHMTVVLGREKEFATELEEIWDKPSN